jgi:hypothetical protein
MPEALDDVRFRCLPSRALSERRAPVSFLWEREPPRQGPPRKPEQPERVS